MPLFRSHSPPRETTPPPAETNHKSGGFFSRRSDSPEYANDYSNNNANGASSVRSGSTRRSGGTGFFSRRRNSSDDSIDLKHEPSIVAARQRVADAEAAEAAADRALNEARAAVRGAKEQVRILEQEALDEARRAKAKQAEAKAIRKSTGRLGRHG